MILAIVGRFDEPGGTIALGTDFSSGTNVRAGMPIGEMEMLQAAGLSPLEIIEAATRDAAAGAGGETSSERSRRVGWRTS